MEPVRKNFHDGSEGKQIISCRQIWFMVFFYFLEKSPSTPFAKETYF
jgi:hypothetical protein